MCCRCLLRRREAHILDTPAGVELNSSACTSQGQAQNAEERSSPPCRSSSPPALGDAVGGSPHLNRFHEAIQREIIGLAVIRSSRCRPLMLRHLLPRVRPWINPLRKEQMEGSPKSCMPVFMQQSPVEMQVLCWPFSLRMLSLIDRSRNSIKNLFQMESFQ